MREFLVCEIVNHKTMQTLLYGFPLKGIIGISTEFEKHIPELLENSIGAAIYNDKLYPVFGYFDKVESPLLKVFLIYEKFAIGVTRLVNRITVDKLLKNESKGKLEGIFYLKDERVLVLDFEDIKSKYSNYKFSPLKLKPERDQNLAGNERENFIILEGTDLAINLKNIEDIVSFEKVCPIHFGKYSGFVSKRDGSIVSVQPLVKNGKWVLITKKNKAFQVSALVISNGQIIKDDRNNTEYLVVGEKNYKILR